MKNKYLIIAAFFLSVQSTYTQSNSFLKIFDNGELGFEYVGEIFENNDSIYLFSSGRFANNSRTIINLKSISQKNGEIVKLFTDEKIIDHAFDITGGEFCQMAPNGFVILILKTIK